MCTHCAHKYLKKKKNKEKNNRRGLGGRNEAADFCLTDFVNLKSILRLTPLTEGEPFPPCRGHKIKLFFFLDRHSVKRNKNKEKKRVFVDRSN